MSCALSLGTANFGMNYGLGNNKKHLDTFLIKKILKAATNEGFSHLDTAAAYGDSEQILGQLLPERKELLITTKLKASDCLDAKTIIQAVKNSLRLTKQDQFWSVLLHDSKVLLEGNSKEVRLGLNEIIDAGLVQHVGISAYNEFEIVQAKAVAPFLSVFQIPENVCDQRSANSSNLTALASEGNLIFIRSIFLQGLLLMNPLSPRAKAMDAFSGLNALKIFCDKNRVSILDLCVGYAKSLTWMSGLVFGVDSERQIHEIASSFKTSIQVDYSGVPKLDHRLLDPRNWS